jgi:hypothetical protein
MYGPNCLMWSYLNCHSKDAKEGSNDRSARVTFPQNGVRSWGSGRVKSASGVSYVFSSLMIWAGTWVAAVLMVKDVLVEGGAGVG